MSTAGGVFAPMTPLQFVQKWKPVTLTERAAAQSHFCDLCRLFDHPDPVAADPAGEWFTFEKGVAKSGGGEGFADVWKRDFFAWEYKKKKRNLDEALGQLARYALALENPPLHVACDTERFRIVTAWTNTVPQLYELTLDDLLVPEKLEILRSAFHQPDFLKPGETRADLTEAAADKFSSIASRLRSRGYPPFETAHFVSRLVFLFFAEDVKLLPNNYFRRVLHEMKTRPGDCVELLDGLFAVLRKGGRFGVDRLPHINGGLFDDRPALSLDRSDIELLIAAGSQNWAHIDPTIFGTLFERLLDPDKRSQIGAHYTDARKIMMILDPVVLRPLRQEWDRAKEEIDTLVSKARMKGPRAKEWKLAEHRRSTFIARLKGTSILDAACGSGNFLYLALQGVKNLEHAANQECEALGLPPRLPEVGPEIIEGIEINPLAAELARTTIWIGDIQWHIQNGFYARPEPLLRPLENIACRDALIESPKVGEPIEAVWPRAEFIVGNPPFLGIRLLRNGLGDAAVDRLFNVYDGRVSREADLVCYWFEKARTALAAGSCRRVGLVATNSIRTGANRKALEQIAKESRIFEAWSDEPWIVDGAAVRVSLICFGESQDPPHLDGVLAANINVDLTTGSLDFTRVKRLRENRDIAYMGDTKGGAFDIPGELARTWLRLPLNPNGRSNADVLRPWRNGMDMTRRSRDMWIIDFGWRMSEKEASLYEAPFQYVKKHVLPERAENRRDAYRERWWRHVEPRPGLWSAVQGKARIIVTPEVSRHRVFTWLPTNVVPDHKLQVIVRDDDMTFGILLSRWHLAWSLAVGSWHGVGNDPRYTIGSCFETFPFPDGLTPNLPAQQYADNPAAAAIALAAKQLDDLRNAWLNPADLVIIEHEATPGYPDRIRPKDAAAATALRERTLTSLYNQRPQWLIDAHRDLDSAVAGAYGWATDIAEDEALACLLQLNVSRASQSEPIAPVDTSDEEPSRSTLPIEAPSLPKRPPARSISRGRSARKRVG